MAPARRKSPRKGAGARPRLIAQALRYPGAWEDHPWGESAIKVGKRVFVFAGMADSDEPRMTVKLTGSHEEALAFPGTAPAGYGLGRSGWVTVPLAEIPPAILEDWVDESYRNVAPKRLVAELTDDEARRRRQRPT